MRQIFLLLVLSVFYSVQLNGQYVHDEHNEGGDVFSHFIFYGPVRHSYVPSKINTGMYCGDQSEAQEKFGVW